MHLFLCWLPLSQSLHPAPSQRQPFPDPILLKPAATPPWGKWQLLHPKNSTRTASPAAASSAASQHQPGWRRPRRSLIPTCDWTPPCQPEQELPQPCPDGSDLRGKWQLSCGIKWTSFNRQTIRSGLINWRAISIVVRNFKPQHCLSQALLSPRFCLLVEVTAVKLCVPSQDYTWSLN